MSTSEHPAGDLTGDVTEAGHRPALDLAFEREALVALRGAVAAHASRLGLDGRRTEELVLIAHELASNAVLHGGGSGRLRLWVAAGYLSCEVSDSGPGLPESHSDFNLPPPAAAGGRGLWLVRALTDDFSVASGPAGTTITVAVRLPG